MSMTEEASGNGSAGTGVTSVAQPEPQSPGQPDGFPRRVLRLLGWGPAQVTSPAARWTVNILALAGAVLIIASAIIHLRLTGLPEFVGIFRVPGTRMSW